MATMCAMARMSALYRTLERKTTNVPLKKTETTYRWLTLADACRYAGIKSRKTMVARILSGVVYGTQVKGRGRIGLEWRVDRESLDAWYGQDRARALAILRS